MLGFVPQAGEQSESRSLIDSLLNSVAAAAAVIFAANGAICGGKWRSAMTRTFDWRTAWCSHSQACATTQGRDGPVTVVQYAEAPRSVPCGRRLFFGPRPAFSPGVSAR